MSEYRSERTAGGAGGVEGVGHVLHGGAGAGGVEETAGVELELAGIDGDGSRALLKRLEELVVGAPLLGVAGDLVAEGSELGRLALAGNALVGVGGLVENTVVDEVLERAGVPATVAALVGGVAGHELLLRKVGHGTRLDGNRRLDDADGAERPATTAAALVLDLGDLAGSDPVGDLERGELGVLSVLDSLALSGELVGLRLTGGLPLGLTVGRGLLGSSLVGSDLVLAGLLGSGLLGSLLLSLELLLGLLLGLVVTLK